MDYNKLIRKIVSEFDLSSELQRKQAYNKCFEYAKENISDSRRFNEFFKVVSNILDIPPTVKDAARDYASETGNEIIHLSYDEKTGPMLMGNKDGLVYLANLFLKLAEINDPHEHSHFYTDEFPMTSTSFPLTVFCKNEDWFEKYAEKSVDENQQKEIEAREIDVKSVVAFMVDEEVPIEVYITRDKIYKILSVEKYSDQPIEIKHIRESTERVYVFQFTDDINQRIETAFDLDDPEVIFFTAENLVQISS